MTKTIRLHWLQQVTKHFPATDEASVHGAQLRVKSLYYCRTRGQRLTGLSPFARKCGSYYPLQASAALRVYFFLSQLKTRSPELIQEFLLGHLQHHLSSGERNQRKPKYIPCRILLGLFANTLFGGI